LIFGLRLSVRFPKRIVPICVNDPTGSAIPFRTASTPAIIVVATAPIPTVRTPNFPFAAAIGHAFFANFFSALSKVEDHCVKPNHVSCGNPNKITLASVSVPIAFQPAAEIRHSELLRGEPYGTNMLLLTPNVTIC
jgi:hypothetical protein